MKDKKKKAKKQSKKAIIDALPSGNSEGMLDSCLCRLLEISRQIEVLRCELDATLQSLLSDAEPELIFNDNRRRISWGNSSVKLGKKSYRFVKTIWLGENHQVTFAEVEENVWGQQIKKKMFVPLSTVAMLVRYTQKNLTEAYFPYKIEPVKNFSSRELEGFRLVSRIARKKS